MDKPVLIEKNPIRILQVLTIMNRGGAEAMIMNYYRNIDRSKVQFDFLLHRKERGYYDDEIESLGGRIYRMSDINPWKLFNYKRTLSHFFAEHQEYKVVHAHLNALSFFVLEQAKKHNVPIRIAHSHTSLLHLNLNPFSENFPSITYILKFFAQNILKSRVGKSANHYFACGEKAGKWLFGKGRYDNVVLIANAIDTDNFVFDPDRSKALKISLGLSDKLVIGHVGNYVPEKNHGFLLKVFDHALELNPNIKLVLAGGGSRMEYIKDLAEKSNSYSDINFLGARSDVPDLLQAMDVFLFPSTNEGLPVTLIEAQAAGLKILASDSISDELDITGNISFLSLDKTPEEWAKRLLHISGYERENTKNKIIEGNYDIVENAMRLQSFYLNQVSKELCVE